MTALAKDEQATAWDLREAWIAGCLVRLTLSERAVVRTIVGKVSKVAVTGVFAVVDGWHVPLIDVLAVGEPTIEDKDAYAAEMKRRKNLALDVGA